MFVWIIEGKLGKAAKSDVYPDNLVPIVVAAEYDTPYKIVDEAIDIGEQRNHIAGAIGMIVALLLLDIPTVVVCQMGLSRSTTIACISAAIWNKTSLDTEWQKLKSKDPGILDKSPVRALAQLMLSESKF